MKTGDIVEVETGDRTRPRRAKNQKAVLIEPSGNVFNNEKLWKVVFLGQNSFSTSYVLEEKLCPLAEVES